MDGGFPVQPSVYMLRPRDILRPVSIFLLVAFACEKPGCTRGPLSITPPSAPPGQIVTVEQKNGGFLGLDSLRVEIGDEPAFIVLRNSNTRIKVMVPRIAPGAARSVVVFDGSHPRGQGTLDVRGTDCELLVFSVVGKTVRFVRKERCAGRPDAPRPSLDARLAVEIVDRQGAVIHRTSVPHPTLAPDESFGSMRDGPSTVVRVPGPDSTSIAIRVPVLPSAHGVRVYLIPPRHAMVGDPHVGTADTSRTFLGSFPLKVQ